MSFLRCLQFDLVGWRCVRPDEAWQWQPIARITYYRCSAVVGGESILTYVMHSPFFSGFNLVLDVLIFPIEDVVHGWQCLGELTRDGWLFVAVSILSKIEVANYDLRCFCSRFSSISVLFSSWRTRFYLFLNSSACCLSWLVCSHVWVVR